MTIFMENLRTINSVELMKKMKHDPIVSFIGMTPADGWYAIFKGKDGEPDEKNKVMFFVATRKRHHDNPQEGDFVDFDGIIHFGGEGATGFEAVSSFFNFKEYVYEPSK